ncbi:MAG: hypothetical protein AB8I08_10230 [Sandaracinaceae bacterium]
MRDLPGALASLRDAPQAPWHMHPIFNRGFLAETFACVFLVGAGFSAGWALAPNVLAAFAEMVGVGAVMTTSPTDHLVVCLKLAFACALPGAVTWMALLIYRGRAHMRPSGRALLALLLVPWIVGVAAEAIRTTWVANVLASTETYGVEAILSAVEFSSGTWASRAIAGTGVLLWIAVFRFAARPPGTPSRTPSERQDVRPDRAHGQNGEPARPA